MSESYMHKQGHVCCMRKWIDHATVSSIKSFWFKPLILTCPCLEQTYYAVKGWPFSILNKDVILVIFYWSLWRYCGLLQPLQMQDSTIMYWVYTNFLNIAHVAMQLINASSHVSLLRRYILLKVVHKDKEAQANGIQAFQVQATWERAIWSLTFVVVDWKGEIWYVAELHHIFPRALTFFAGCQNAVWEVCSINSCQWTPL